ncbi:RND family transporter, partial [Enterococcus faecium]|uniref:MMPL family transporter n=1 Tax=Enterococcus faecium TaxID=1352 RepID=UPI001133E6A8
HQALFHSLRINFKPIFFTSATTALGFLSMNFSDVPPFQDLGNMVAFGVMFTFVLSVTLFPALLMLLPLRVSVQKQHQSSPAMATLSNFVVTHYR